MNFKQFADLVSKRVDHECAGNKITDVDVWRNMELVILTVSNNNGSLRMSVILYGENCFRVRVDGGREFIKMVNPRGTLPEEQIGKLLDEVLTEVANEIV